MRYMAVLGIGLLCGSPCLGTIDIIIKTPEAVVFASDSRTTTTTEEILTDTYEKIVHVTTRIMAQTAGAAMPANKNFRTTLQDFKWKYNIADTSLVLFDSLLQLFRVYCTTNRERGADYSRFTVWFAGPDSLGNIRCCQYWPKTDSVTMYNGYSVWRAGIANPIDRLLLGIDGDLRNELDSLARRSVDSSKADSLSLEIKSTIGKYSMIESTDVARWSLQDAIDYAYMMVHMTIIADRMSLGKFSSDQKSINPRTGGRILMAVVTRDGVKWILPPEYSPLR